MSDVQEKPTPSRTDEHRLSATVVSGEAPESDDDEFVEARGISSSDKQMVSSATLPEPRVQFPKYDGPFNVKLCETNVQARALLVKTMFESFDNAAKTLQACAQQTVKTSSVLQELNFSRRSANNILFQLDDKLDVLTNERFLPDINIPEKNKVFESATRNLPTTDVASET